MTTTPTADLLRSFLTSPARPEGTITYHGLQGFLFAVACSPEPVEASEWTQAVCAGKDPAYASADEEAQVVDALSRLYADIQAGVQAGAPVLPADLAIASDVMANFDEGAALCEWSRGFNEGDGWLAESWDIELPDDVAEALDTTVMLLTLFGEREQAEAAEQAGEFGEETLASLAARAIGMIPEAMKTYAMIGREVLAPAYAEAAAEPVEQRRVEKIGRNEPCPCGSGKKFKQCCGK